jgi:pSer/pThr/pTyr-binding forkhead associated (FHA) protein
MFVLEVMSGPLDGKTWNFDQEIIIGRDDAVATACITIDRYISRKHARLLAESGGFRVVDLQSRNGTRVGGVTIDVDAQIALGETFQVGRTLLRVLNP